MCTLAANASQSLFEIENAEAPTTQTVTPDAEPSIGTAAQVTVEITYEVPAFVMPAINEKTGEMTFGRVEWHHRPLSTVRVGSIGLQMHPPDHVTLVDIDPVILPVWFDTLTVTTQATTVVHESSAPNTLAALRNGTAEIEWVCDPTRIAPWVSLASAAAMFNHTTMTITVEDATSFNELRATARGQPPAVE